MQFLYPELFLLAIPVWFAFRRWGQVRGVTGWLRLLTLVVLLLALTGPRLNVGGRGIDVVVVADRSRSLPAEAHDNIRELIQNLENNRGQGDRLGIVTFGSGAHVEQILKANSQLGEYTKDILPDGSDMNEAVIAALNLVDRDRPARILVLSDGEANGASPLSAARRGREQGVPVDFRAFERVVIGDVAIESILLPDVVSPREPFQFSVWIYADKDARGTVRVLRDGELITATERDFSSGMNRLLCRDLLDASGFFHYSVTLDVANDPLLENNMADGVVRVDGGPSMLVLNTDGADGNLVSELRAARIPVHVAIADQHSLTQDSLDPYRGVIVENVPAADLGRIKMERLAQFVEDLGGGLMLTGGERSYGTGGYFKSPLDEVLPVSMELREEHRKSRVALAIALDRSGSMTAPVRGGKTKMDLANLGTAECVRLLAPSDMVAVIAVDSSPHVVQPLIQVEDSESIANHVLRIESMGGGIFVYEALVAAGTELLKAGNYQTRHIILFADAADSEEPGRYKTLLKKFADSGITVSVIGLGTTADVDARLLEEIAKLGSGNIMFTTDAQELPRLFTQDTMSIARNTFVQKEPETQPGGIPGRLLPDARLMGNLGRGGFPNVDGYNLSYLKPNATLAVITQDEYNAPLSAFWYRGLGRVAALTMEVDGQYSGQFGEWQYYDDFVITHARWILGGTDPDELFLKIERQGQDSVVTVELDPELPAAQRSQPPQLIVVPPGNERTQTIVPDFIWTGPHTLQARFRMDRIGTYRTLVKSDHRKFTRGPAVTLPYSPEYVPRIGLPNGKEILSAMSALSGGKERTDVLEVFADPPRSARTVSLLPWLFFLGICLLLLEIAGRRLSLWQRLIEPRVSEKIAAAKQKKRAAWLPQLKLRLPTRKKSVPQTVSPSESEARKPQSAPTAESATTPGRSVANILAQAKNRAKRRLK